MPEVLGVATVCVEGRKRRHLGTAAICRMILSNASQALLEPQRLATAFALGLRAVSERMDFEVDHLYYSSYGTGETGNICLFFLHDCFRSRVPLLPFLLLCLSAPHIPIMKLQ